MAHSFVASILLPGVIALTMLGTSVVADMRSPKLLLADVRSYKLDLNSDVPGIVGHWRQVKAPSAIVNPQTEEALGNVYDQTLARTYVNEVTGQSIMLSIAYGRNQRKRNGDQLHLPEVCYPAQGLPVTAVLNFPFSTIGDARTFEAKRGGSTVESVTYWVVFGNRRANTSAERRSALNEYAADGVIPDGLVVRLSSISQGAGYDRKSHLDFAESLAKALNSDAKSLLIPSH